MVLKRKQTISMGKKYFISFSGLRVRCFHVFLSDVDTFVSPLIRHNKFRTVTIDY